MGRDEFVPDTVEINQWRVSQTPHFFEFPERGIWFDPGDSNQFKPTKSSSISDIPSRPFTDSVRAFTQLSVKPRPVLPSKTIQPSSLTNPSLQITIFLDSSAHQCCHK